MNDATNALSDIIAKIQKSKREDVRNQILYLQTVLGSTENLFADRRSLSWQEGGLARAKVDARKYKLSWRGSAGDGSSIECTLMDAAKIIGRTEASICQSVNKGGGVFHTKDVDDDMVTIQRL